MPPAKTKSRATPKTYGPQWARISKFALALPGVEARSSYGTPGLYAGKKLMARLRDNDYDHMVLKPIEDDEQRFLMETQPDVFFLTPHYVGYPTILIRLSNVDPAQLEDLVEQSWRRLATKTMLVQREIPGPDTTVRAHGPAPRRTRAARVSAPDLHARRARR
jgi:hypothetical protein